MLTTYPSNWKWPEVPNLDKFQGELIHTANWPENFDYSNKTVAVIGNGSSGIQVVPAIFPGSAPEGWFHLGDWLTFPRVSCQETLSFRPHSNVDLASSDNGYDDGGFPSQIHT